jgi:hypothetical protein
MEQGSMPNSQTKSVSIVIISKDEFALADTLDLVANEVAALSTVATDDVEILVVDASAGRLDEIRVAHPLVHWIDFVRPSGVRISIPHQRNRGVREAHGDIIVFTDCGCIPDSGWLAHLLKPILSGEEQMASGQTGATGRLDPHRYGRFKDSEAKYLQECPTINVAFLRRLFFDIGGFDESFEYGSDLDFSWRLVHKGVRIRYVPEALIRHDWGDRRRQNKRSFAYGKARVRLYEKHAFGVGEQSIRKRRLNESDAVAIVYPLYLLGLPIVLKYRSYLLLLLVPIWRNRRERPVDSLVDHFVFAAGVITQTVEILRRTEPSPIL